MKNKALNDNISSGFKVPDNYFSTIESPLLNEVKLKIAIDESGYKIPSDYFKTFDDTVLTQLNTEKESKILTLFPLKKVLAFTAIAASLVILFGLAFNIEKTISFESLETIAIEDYLEDEDYTNYELTLLLTEDALNTDNFTETQISEDDLSDYLLNHSDLEDLIIE